MAASGGKVRGKMYSIEYLKEHSNLPGPRGNLELLYAFVKDATENQVIECLNHITDNVENSPEEFICMCGIVGYAVHHRNNIKELLNFLKKYASHNSWRIREAVAMAIQESSENNMKETLESMDILKNGNSFERRAVVAGLCEPKLLKDKLIANEVIDILAEITDGLDHNEKLSAGDESLRKALAYGWSVAIVHAPEKGKKAFNSLLDCNGKHIKWIIKENLKKNRLIKLDPQWVKKTGIRLANAPI